MRVKLATAFVVALVIAASCSEGSDDAALDDDSVVTEEPSESVDTDDGDAGDTDDTGIEIDDEIDDVDLALVRDDVDCSPDAIGADDTPFTTVHYVVDGVLGAPCLGDVDDTVLDAWHSLAVIAPTLARADLGLFGGYTGDEESDEVTLAFVNSIDFDGDLFQMSVNLDAYQDDANEALLTMAHEFSHVFTQLPSQLDRTLEAADNCDTYYNGEGCFYDSALMWRYMVEFWPQEFIDEFDPEVEASNEVGAERCALNPDFLGPYAASNPEEDFAETFSAFVFELDVDPALDDKIAWMASQLGLAEFRDRAIDAGLTPLDNNFEPCG